MTAALIVIDVQQSFRTLENWSSISAPDIADRVARLVEHARATGTEVVWVLHTEPGTGGPFDPESGLVELLDGLKPEAGELVVRKTSHNAFTTTNLAQHLTRRMIGEVLIAGIRTEQCCETTARVASDLGYDVTFVLDATATHPLPRWAGGDPLPVEAVIERTAAALQGRFARVVTLDDILT